MRRLIVIIGLALGVLGVGVSAFAQDNASDNSQAMYLAVDPQPLTISNVQDEHAFSVEVADTDNSRMRGLMFRTDLPEDRAMIFVFDDVRPITMWMRNTPLSLDMLFIRADGTIARILESTKPFSEDLLGSGEPVAFVIEINGGITKKLGIRAGDNVRHRTICGDC